MYRELNLNPEKKRVGDCTVRAIAAATHEFMDALKEARPDVYNDLVHSLQRK